MTKHLIVHCTHAGCYDYKSMKDDNAIPLMTRVKINAPRVFMFDDKFQASEFFHEYMNEIDCIDIRCRQENETIHLDNCTCGVVNTNEDGDPILFYNKVHQIFLLDMAAQTFTPSKDLRIDINNMNLTNSHIIKCKTLSKTQRESYIELGRVCQGCSKVDYDDDDDDE
jgi:hypothetical protein